MHFVAAALMLAEPDRPCQHVQSWNLRRPGCDLAPLCGIAVSQHATDSGAGQSKQHQRHLHRGMHLPVLLLQRAVPKHADRDDDLSLANHHRHNDQSQSVPAELLDPESSLPEKLRFAVINQA